MSFTHLKVFTGHSITKSIVNTDNLIEKITKENGQAVSVVDTNNLFNAISVYEEALSKGIKPVLGATLYVYDEDGKKSEVSVYVKSQVGYHNLNRLISRAWLENNHEENTGIKKEWINAKSIEGLIVLSGARHGKIGQHILEGNMPEAQKEVEFWQRLVGDDFFIELQRDATEFESAYMQGAVELCETMNVSPVATHPVYFLEQEDYLIHEIKTCIASGDTLYDVSRPFLYNKDMYFKSEEEMRELFSDIPVALDNTQKIVQKCNFQLQLGKSVLPTFDVPAGTTEAEFLKEEARRGLEARLLDLYPNEDDLEDKRETYQKRLETELGIINSMEFPGYFLIVADFIKYAKDNDIPVGPGRGSGAGSLVAYSLGITDLDPLQYGLLFERFLNPERVSMPDFDIDFCSDRRVEVLQYVRQKYGQNRVAQISTFSMLGGKAAIRDVARVLKFHNEISMSISKLITIPPAKAHEIDLQTFLFGNAKKGIPPDEKLLNLYNAEAEVKTIIDLALKLDGLPRQIGTHPGGVVIAPTEITDFTPMYKKDNSGDIVSQFDKDDVEKAGLVKFDFLATKILTTMHACISEVNKKKKASGEELLDINKINLQDEVIFSEIFGTGNTNGIFQFESNGMKSLFKQIQPNRFEDLIAINALYRPGPMDIIPDWIRARENADSIEYEHESLRGILAETYGFMIYQEQVMQCAQIIAGYSLGGADLLRRAMGKKKPEEMAKQRSIFVEGAAKNNIGEELANMLFDKIDKFSGYGFNKSHAAAYSLVGYQNAYLKYYHTAEYITSFLNSEEDTDGIQKYILDAKNNKLRISPPNINKSCPKFTITSSDEIQYSLSALKGVGVDPAENIRKIREEGGEFLDIFDFLERIPKGTISKRSFDPMVQAGVFDCIYPNRAELLENAKALLEYQKKFQEVKLEESKSVLMKEIPGFAATSGQKVRKLKIVERPVLKEVADWDEKQKAAFEKSSIGFYLTTNPMNFYNKELGGFPAADSIGELENQYNEIRKDRALIAGMITDIREYKTKNGAFITIESNNETVSLMTKKDVLEKHADLLKPDNFAVFNISMFEFDSNPGEIKYSTQDIYDLDTIQKMTVNKVFVAGTDAQLDLFTEIAAKHPGDTLMTYCVEREPDGRRDKVLSRVDVDFTPALMKELRQNFGENWVKMTFKDKINIVNKKPNGPRRY